MMLRRVLALLLLALFAGAGEARAAVALGTNAGFVSSSPTADPGGTGDYADNSALAVKDTAPPTATTVTEIGWWCDNATQETNYEVGIYTWDAGNTRPGSLIAGASLTNAKGTGAGWKKVTGLSIAVTAGTAYAIAVQIDDTSTTTNLDFSASAGNTLNYKDGATTFTDPWGANATVPNRIYSIYAVWSAGGTAGTVVLSGSGATASRGTLTVTGDAAPALAGIASTSATGTLTPSTTVNGTATLAGEATTAGQGTLAAPGGGAPALSGAAATASAGTLTAPADGAAALSGASSTATPGSLTATEGAIPVTAALAGSGTTAAHGTLSVAWTRSDAPALTGESVTSTRGTLTVSGAASVGLSGAAVIASAGTLGVSVGEFKPYWIPPEGIVW